ncbi:conserved hypothetical protein [Culex quinquefasciatus]|uniref:Uncharacterized protein n=1 Tax=Culex quinquefasciatus TaxID=7176 RepID=B0X202_CULQU|nr:conserved hypothetical protein [Culex quinquefasciatus]|eukprot:XP_001863674.1 conserved hypothetical protein [Culex quinquefasciatus]
MLNMNNVLPNGEANKTGPVYDLLHATRHASGHYKCTADNRVGQPDSRDILVNVLSKKFGSQTGPTSTPGSGLAVFAKRKPKKHVAATENIEQSVRIPWYDFEKRIMKFEHCSWFPFS